MWSSEEQGVETTSWSSRHGFNVSPSIYLLFNDKAINNPVEEKKSRGKKRRARERRERALTVPELVLVVQ